MGRFCIPRLVGNVDKSVEAYVSSKNSLKGEEIG